MIGTKQWQPTRLKDQFSIIGGNGFSPELQGRSEGDYPFCKCSDIKMGGKLSSAANYVSSEDVIHHGYNIISPNSILVAKIGESMKKNRRALNLTACCIDNNMQAFVPKKSLDPIFGYFLLELIDFADYDNGGPVPSINNQRLLTKVVHVPPLLEQRRIGLFIENNCTSLDNTINGMERQITLLERYRASIIHEAVTRGLDPTAPTNPSGIEWISDIPENWKLRKLKHLLKTFESGTSVRAANYPADKGEKGVLSLSAVFGGKYNPQANKRIDDDELTRASCPVKTGCLLISRCNTSELVGLPAYVEKGDRGLYLPDKIWQLDSGQKDINRFIYYAMQSKHAREYCAVMSVGSSESMQNIASFDLLNMHIAIPVGSDEAKHIADYLDARTAAIDAVLDTKRKQIEILKRRRQSLIYEYVTGKRRVTEEA